MTNLKRPDNFESVIGHHKIKNILQDYRLRIPTINMIRIIRSPNLRSRLFSMKIKVTSYFPFR